MTASRIPAARAAQAAATAALEQTIRDERAAGTSVSDLCRELGTTSRKTVYAILGRGEGDTEPTMPPLRPVVYLRGAGAKPETWQRIEHTLWARGWATTHHHADAWHLARGGTPVIMLDFTPAEEKLFVARVRARNDDRETVRQVADLLPTAEQVRLIHEKAPWREERVLTVETTPELQVLFGGAVDRPLRTVDEHRVIDEHAVARIVAGLLQ